jgi:hypothetical protein
MGHAYLEERRKTMNFVCEVPVLIEQRLFALARAIQQSLECPLRHLSAKLVFRRITRNGSHP